MPIIHTLSRQEAQKIAAGEVVERPASVVKELIENSIDAGATAITVAIKDGGRTLISCADNGCGMDPIDARICIGTHATSKITKVEDLFALNTFGFRGEALASLAAVSTLHITTKDTIDSSAIHLVVKHGAIVTETAAAREKGTTIEVYALFSMIPARLKFLKKDETEVRHITQLFDALFLAHPTIHAKLVVNEVVYCNYPDAKTILERAQQILQHKTHIPLIAVSSTKHGITIEGAISTHHTYRFDRSSLYLFVNRRWVKNNTLVRAVMRAYTALPEGKFPIVSLHIIIDSAIVDVNIHPRKEEVAFTNSGLVEQAITAAIKEALERECVLHLQGASVLLSGVQSLPAPWHTASQKMPDIETTEYPASVMNRAISESLHKSFVEHTQKGISLGEEPTALIVGQLDATYILTTTEQGLTIVDQHAAHERVLYEQFVTRFGAIDTVQLLFPEIIQLSSDDFALCMTYQTLLAQHGVIAEQFGNNQIRVTALPIFTKHISAQQLIAEFIATIHEAPVKADAYLFVTNALRAQMACKAAVKAGDTLTILQMEQLLRDLAKAPNKLTCPHGRPTYWLITIAELEKKFQRVT